MVFVDIAQVLILSLCAGVAVFMTTVCLKNWRDSKFLCTECKYNDPEMCNKAERPNAVACLAFSEKKQ